MAERTYALNTGAGLFVDTETGLKVVPGEEVKIDLAKAGQMTQTVIRSGGLIEVEPKKKADKKEEGQQEPPK